MITRAVVGAVLVATLVATAAPARADGEIGLSLDGQSWLDQLSRPLFEPTFRWVPGDRDVASFYVRNEGPSSARLSIGARSSDPDTLLARKDIALAARVAGGSWIPLANGRPSTQLTREAIGRGDSTRVDVRVTFVASSPNRSQADRLPLTLVVTLVDGRIAGEPVTDDTDHGARLPDTGADVEPWLIWLAAGLIGSGFALVVARRRHHEEENEQFALDEAMAHG